MKIETVHLPVERSTDDRGRVRLATAWANKRVRVVVVEEVEE